MKEIQLTRGYVAVVDDDDYVLLSKYKWFALKQKTGIYARRSISKHCKIAMHTQIMNTPLGLEIDHIDGNGLNNRRTNLRVVTRRQNQQNKHILKRSPLLGVSFDSRHNKWQSKICVNGKIKFLGSYDSDTEAHIRYVQELDMLGEIMYVPERCIGS